MRHSIPIAALSVVALLAAPSLAGAATEVRTQQIQGLDVVVAVDANSPAQIETVRGVDSGQPFTAVQSSAGSTPATGCVAATPTIVGCNGDFDAILVFGNGGNDKIEMDLTADELTPSLAPLHGEAYGGAGNDELRAPPDNRVGIQQPETYIEGEGGNDTIVSGNGRDELHGGDGSDTIDAWRGRDIVRGGPGNDTVSAGKEEPAANVADVLDGGPGFDAIPIAPNDYDRGFDDKVSITVDGRANDGEPGEGDNVIGVEKLRVRAAQVTLVGSGANDDFFVEAGRSTIRGLGGNDRLVAYDGNDNLEGGDGDDYLEGGFGHDSLSGGPGVDQFSGDRTERDVFAVGNDKIFARDGNSERVDCGISADTAQVDGSDVVANCESVDRGGGPGGNPCEAAEKKVKKAKKKLKKAKKSGKAAKVKKARKKLKKAKAAKKEACS